jgi:hypothetical protein
LTLKDYHRKERVLSRYDADWASPGVCFRIFTADPYALGRNAQQQGDTKKSPAATQRQ